MPYYVGLDVSVETTSICILSEDGRPVLEVVTPSEPVAIVAALRGRRWRYKLVVLEAGSLSEWLCKGLVAKRMPAICIETKHASAVLKTRQNKTDRNDARGLAELARNRHLKPVHVKSDESQLIRGLLAARRGALRKLVDIEGSIRGVLLPFGLKVRRVQRKAYVQQARDLVARRPEIQPIIEPLLGIHRALDQVVKHYDEQLKAIAAADPVCRRLMTAPGVGPLVALTYRATIDVPSRFARSRDVGPFLGLTPKVQQSGVTAWRSRISKAGDGAARSALFAAAKALLPARRRSCALREWGLAIKARAGGRKALVAVARRLAVILHRMWVSETDFRWDEPPVPVTARVHA